MTAPQPPSFPTGPSGTGAGPGAGAPQPAAPAAQQHPAQPHLAQAPGAAPPAAGPPTAPAPGRTRRTGRAIGFTLAAALLVFVTVVLVLFVVFNTQTVDISLVFGNVQAPLVLALVIGAVLGGLVVGLASLALRARRSGR